MTRVKTYIARVMKSEAINIFEIDENLASFSDSIKALLVGDFDEYSLSLERFLVVNIVKPGGDRQFEKFKELHFRQYADIAEAKLRQQTDLIYAQTEAQKIVIDSQAQATKRAQEGYTYHQERGFDVAAVVAGNQAVGQFTNMGIGLGTMAGVGTVVGGVVGSSVTTALNSQAAANAPQTKSCSNCGAVLGENAAFCDECGTPVSVILDFGFCDDCGFKFEKSGKFCPKCGTKRGE